MKKTITPEYVLKMLQELKELIDQRKFEVSKFVVKYPSYSAFRRQLYLKGIIKKEFGYNKWISIEPNIIMAKELIKLYSNYTKEANERHQENKKANQKIQVLENLQEEINSNNLFKKPQKRVKYVKKNTAMALAKQIRQEGEVWTDAVKRASVIMKGGTPKTNLVVNKKNIPTRSENDLKSALIKIDTLKNHLQAKNEQIESIHEIYSERTESLQRKYKQLQEELVQERESIDSLKNLIKIREQEIKNLFQDREELIDTIESREKEIEKLVNRIDNLEKPLPEPTYFPPQFLEPEVSKPQEKVDTSKGSRTYKLFGIPVFSINNK